MFWWKDAPLQPFFIFAGSSSAPIRISECMHDTPRSKLCILQKDGKRALRRARHTNTIRHKRQGLCITTKTLSPQKDNMQAFLDGQTPSRNSFDTSPWPSSEHVVRERPRVLAQGRAMRRVHANPCALMSTSTGKHGTGEPLLCLQHCSSDAKKRRECTSLASQGFGITQATSF